MCFFGGKGVISYFGGGIGGGGKFLGFFYFCCKNSVSSLKIVF